MTTIIKIKTDIQANRKCKKINYIKILYLLFFSYHSRALILIRLAEAEFKIVSFLSRIYLRKNYHIEIGNQTSIGTPLRIPHPRSIIIASSVVIGNNVQINQNVTIGGNNQKFRMDDKGKMIKVPHIGSNVGIYQGAVIAGPVIIGDNVIIGANVVITKNVEPNSLIYLPFSVAKTKIIIPENGGTFLNIKDEYYI